MVAQGSVLGDEIRAILENGDHYGEKSWELERHPANHRRSPNWPEKPAISLSYRIMTRDNTVAHILRLLATDYLGMGKGSLFRKRRITFSVNRDTLFL